MLTLLFGILVPPLRYQPGISDAVRVRRPVPACRPEHGMVRDVPVPQAWGPVRHGDAGAEGAAHGDAWAGAEAAAAGGILAAAGAAVPRQSRSHSPGGRPRFQCSRNHSRHQRECSL